jgi:hypothetical protein
MSATQTLPEASRELLVRRALEEIPLALHGELEDIALEPRGRAVHQGRVMELVFWHARWRREGWPPMSGPLALHDGHVY